MIFLHNPTHNGDVLASSQFAKLLIKDNPHVHFKIVPSCASVLFEDFVNETPNCELIQHPSPWVFTENNTNTNDYIHKIRNELLHVDSNCNLYLNLWRFMLINNSCACIDLTNVVQNINNLIPQIKDLCNIQLNFNPHQINELIPRIPLYDVSFMNTFMDRNKYKKIIFFYNLMGCSGQELPPGFNPYFINMLLKNNPDSLIIVPDNCDIKHPNLLSLTDDMNIKKEHSGKSLVLYANICNLCDEVYFKDNGGSLFTLNPVNISNTITQYYFIGHYAGTYEAIKNVYKLNCQFINYMHVK